MGDFIITTEDGESFFDYVRIDPSERKNSYPFEINLKPIYALTGYTTIDIDIEFLSYGDKHNAIPYLIFDTFELTANDIMLETISKPQVDSESNLNVENIINLPNYVHILSDRLSDAYETLDNAWLTLAAEGFNDYGQLVKLYRDSTDKLQFEVQENNEFYFRSLPEHDRRLVDPIGFHLNAYDLEQPEYLEGEINLYAGKGKHQFGEVYEGDKQFIMDWNYNDFTVDFDTFDANQYNYFLSELPLTSQDLFVEGQLYLHHRINISESQNVIISDLPVGVEFAVVIPDSTERIDSVDIEHIDRIAQPWDWCESWQGYSLTSADFLGYNPSEARTYPSPFVKLDSVTEYELVVNSNGQYQVNFYTSLSNVINALSTDLMQIDFHINHLFSRLDYEILEDVNTYNSKLMWKFPSDGFNNWKLFSYHPDLTRRTTFNVSFFHISEYAQMEDWKTSFTEEFNFYPLEYNFTEFSFSKFEEMYYEVSLNLSHGGDFEYIRDTGKWELIQPFSMNIQTRSGERFVEDFFFKDWKHDETHPDQLIFTFKLRDFSFERMGIVEDSKVLVTYYYQKETFSYYTSKDEILYGDSFSFIIKDSKGNLIQNEEVIASIKGNNITFAESIKNYLDIGEKFTVQFEAKSKGGLLETKHIIVEVQPWEMQFYNKIYPFSGCSIIAPIYYNLSSQYQYQLALNYRLLEKSALTQSFEVKNPNQYGQVHYYLDYDVPVKDYNSEPVVFVYFYNNSNEKTYLASEHIDYKYNTRILTLTVKSGSKFIYDLSVGDEIHVEIVAEFHNKYQHYHEFQIDLTNNRVILTNWTMAQAPEKNLLANLEMTHLIYDIDPNEAISNGVVKQISALLNSTNSLTYYLSEELNDPDNGWLNFNTLIMKMGLLNSDILSHINIEFYYTDVLGVDHLIGTSIITLDMIEGEKGIVYLRLPISNEFSKYTIENKARMVFNPVFYDETDFQGYYYENGFPYLEIIEWDETLVVDGKFSTDIEGEINPLCEKVLVFNEMMELIYEIPLQSENNTILLSDTYIDAFGNTFVIRDGDILFLKYNAVLQKSIGLIIEDMVLQRAPYIENYKKGEFGEPDFVPFAELSFLGINGEDQRYIEESDLNNNRNELVAWEIPLDLTPFEDSFWNTYHQKIINVSFDDFRQDFKTYDGKGNEYVFITDLLVTSNDPRYQVVINSLYIFEFDSNATLYDSTISEIYQNNHMNKYYFGNYSNIYQDPIIFNVSEFLPLYHDNTEINESLYFESFDRHGNSYNIGEHLLSKKLSQDVYELEWNPFYSEEYYYASQDPEVTSEKLKELYEYYHPFIDRFNYLYVSWSDSNAWREWHTIERPNVDVNSLEITYEWFDENLNDYNSITYDQNSNEVEARQIAVERLYPYNITSSRGVFQLSQDYSQALNLEIISIEGYYFNESKGGFDLNLVLFDKNSIEIAAPNGIRLDVFEKIVVLIGFDKGVYSDYTQFRLSNYAIFNHPEAPAWTKNDTLFVNYEYHDLDYFLLFEDYGVGTDDSLFEYLDYTRNKMFMVDSNDMYAFDPSAQQIDFELFNGTDDLRTCLEMKDFDMNGVHEYVVEKQDITGDGIYNSFKYGFVNPAGEISFHTLIQKVETSQTFTERNGGVKESKSFELNWKDLWRKYNVVAQTVVTNNVTTDTSISKMNLLIQKDFESDGIIDGEVSFEAIYTNVKVITYTEENTTLYFYPTIGIDPQPVAQEYLVEKTTSTYNYSDVSCSFVFKEFVDNEVNSTRLYQDIFPNELTELNDIENYLTAISCDFGDTDPSNDIITDAPYLEGLLTLSHPEDGISSVFESKTVIQDGEIINVNLLSNEVALKFTGGHQYYAGFYGHSADNNIKSQVIEVTPSGGVFYDNTYQYGPQKVSGSYLYYDSNNDNRFETIFVVDECNNVLAVGFDYDGDGYFLPNKVNLVKKQIELTENSAEHKEDIYNILTYELDSPYGDLLRFNESSNGYRLEPTLSDSLFELWKTAYEGSSSALLKEVSDKKANEFIENVWNKQLVEDILWQVEAQAIAIIGAAFGFAMGSIIPGLGNVAGGKIGYILTYATVNIIRSLNQQRDLGNFIARQSFYNTHFKSSQTLSSKWWMDTWFGDLPTNALFGSSRGVYAPIKRQTANYEYTAEVILASSGIAKSDFLLGENYKPLILDYALQTKNLVAYSDFDNWMLKAFLKKRDGFGWNTDPLFMHSENSILYLEDQIYSATTQNEDILLDNIMPYMVYSVPTLEFTDSQGSISPLEFYETHPIYVSAEKYEQVKKDYNIIYKISNLETSELQLIPETSVHYLYSDVISIDVYLVWSITNLLYSADYSYLETLETEDFEFNPLTGVLTINEDSAFDLKEKLQAKQAKYSEKEVTLCFEVRVEKYRSIEDLRELSREKVDQIVTMQMTQANVLEYYYQFNLASKQEEQLQELAYTTVVTAISTAISMGVSFGIGKVVGLANKYLGSLVNLPDLAGITGIQSASKVQQFLHEFSTYIMQASVSLSDFAIVTACLKEISQEIFIDPLVETLVSNLVREMGYDATIQMIASTLAESLREEFSGQISSMFKGGQSDFTFQNYMDKRLTSEHQYPIGQELIQYFNEYKAGLLVSQDKKYDSRLLGVLGTSLKLFVMMMSIYSIFNMLTQFITSGTSNILLAAVPPIWIFNSKKNIIDISKVKNILPQLDYKESSKRFNILSDLVTDNNPHCRKPETHFTRHNYVIVSNFLKFKELSCIKCGNVIGIYNLQNTENIFNKKLNRLNLINLEKRKSPNDLAIYSVRFKKNVDGNYLEFPGLIYCGKSIQQVKEEIKRKYRGRHGELGEYIKNFKFKNVEEFMGHLYFNVLQIIRYDGNKESTLKRVDQAERFWIGFFKSQFKEFGLNVQEGGSNYIIPRKIIPLPDLEAALNDLIYKYGMFHKNQGPRDKILEILGVTREDLEPNLQWSYGTISVVEIIRGKVKILIKALFEKGYNPTEISVKLPLRFGEMRTRPDYPITKMIKEIYKNTIPNIANLRINEVRDIILSKKIKEKIREGYTTYKSLLVLFPGLRRTNGRETTGIKQFVLEKMGGLKNLIEENKVYINRILFTAAKHLIIQNQGNYRYAASNILKDLIDMGVLLGYSKGTVNGRGPYYFEKILEVSFKEFKKFCLTNRLH